MTTSSPTTPADAAQDSRLRAAIVGTGAVAHLHAQALLADDRVQLVAVCDRDPDRSDAFAERYGVPWSHASLDDLLDDRGRAGADDGAGRPDVVILCTPPDVHREQALAAFAAGVHVICEKPPALSLAELDEMQAAADTAGVAFATVFQQRTGTAGAHVRDLLRSGAVGRPLLAQCQTLWLRGDEYYAADWRGTWEGEGGGTTLGHGIHQMDLLAHLLGDWAEVDARLWRLARDIEMEDASTATIRFTSGAVAVAVSSVLSPREVSAVRIDTELATIEVEHLYGHSGDSWRITPARGVSAETAASWVLPEEDEPSGHAPLLRAVVDALVTGAPLPDLVTHARRPLELVTAIYASATRRRPVTPTDLDADDRFRRSLRADVTDVRPGV